MNAFINTSPGATVFCAGKSYVITAVLSLESVLAKEHESGKIEQLKIDDLRPPNEKTADADKRGSASELSLISAADWAAAREWYERLRPLLAEQRTLPQIKAVADAAGVHYTTVYRKLKVLDSTGRLSALIPSRSDGGRSGGRLDPAAEVIIKSTIEDFHLKRQKPTIKKTVEEVEVRCRRAKIDPPHRNTIVSRIRALRPKDVDKARLGSKVASEEHDAFPGRFPGADFPLAIVQIDHTPLDIVVVDDVHREPIGRPWLTAAIDTYSRMVTGFYISLDRPDTLAVGLCLAHSILPKETWLARHDITTPWSCWGVMTKIHADNAGEFRGDMLKRACQEYGIDLEWRPVKQPRYGAHIERLMGTFAQEMHALPGTTFANPEKRGEYDSDKEATMTVSELEGWLAEFITGKYHQRLHSGIGAAPVKRYEAGILGTDEQVGRGLPFKVQDEDRLRLDLMPYEERTIQEYGIVIDYIHYFGDVLRRFVYAKDPDHPKRSRKFIFKRNPRDISQVYFYDPDLKEYFVIPYRDTGRPPMTLWEHRAAIRRLEEQGVKEIDEERIFETHERLRAREEAAKTKTKKARRDGQRRALSRQTPKPKTADDKATERALNDAHIDDDRAPAPLAIVADDEIELL